MDGDYHQGFNHAINDEVFCKENVYKWFPNPILLKEELIRDKKKPLGVSFEKEGNIVFAIAPKCYILKSSKNENDESVNKMKTISFRLNDNIELESYKSCLEQSSVLIIGTNRYFIVVKSNPYSHTRHMG
jgi:hypothetical protein